MTNSCPDGDRDPDSATTSVYLARHGRTALNAAGMLRGHLDPSLDEIGKLEAEALAKLLAPFRPSLVVSSPLRRALETAQCVADECGVEVEVDQQLIDRDYGRWAGRSEGELRAEWGSVDEAPGVESRDSVRHRARAALETIADEAVAQRVDHGVVIVAHDAINRLLIVSIDPIRFGGFETIPQRTGSFNVLQRTWGIWSVTRVDIRPANGPTALGAHR